MTSPLVKVQSPEWWVARLYKALSAQREQFEVFDAYYRGEHPLPWLAPQAQDDFRRVLKMARANYMGLVVDAQVERCNLDGFRVGDAAQGDKDTWRIWQANNLDAGFDQVLLESAIGGSSFLMVAPNPRDPATPIVTAEHPTQAIVEYVPGSSRRDRAAGLKVWVDDWTGMLCATLYLPIGVFKFQTRQQNGVVSGTPQWDRRMVQGETWPAPNPLGVVPLVEIPNNPRLLTGGVSELSDVIDIQDRINKTLADRLITQDYGAFPQKWATAWPEEDGQGQPTKPINVGRDRMVTSEIEQTKFGQWDAADLDPYSGAKREDVKDVASRTRTPAQYLLGEMSNVNGETLKASESGLVSKCRQRMRPYGDGAEETARLFRRTAGLADVGDAEMEAIWRSPEFRTEGELTAALLNMNFLHVPQQVLWERWGATPQEIARWIELNKQNKADGLFQDPTSTAGDTPPQAAREPAVSRGT